MTRETQPTAVVFDLDHTITDCDTYKRFLMGLVVRRPGRWLRCLPLPFDMLKVRRGAQDNHWLKERALGTIAAGLAPEVLKQYCAAMNEMLLAVHLRPGAVSAIAAHKSQGHRLILASASFDFYVEGLAERLGFTEIICTRAELGADQRLTGRIAGRNCYGEEKLRRVAEAFSADRQAWQTIVYTDHHTDLPLLEWADERRVVHPDSRLRAVAEDRGFEVLDWS